MARTRELYLLWSLQGWGVFYETDCPDPYGLPTYWYKKYEVPEDKDEPAFNKLLERRNQLVEEKVIPTKENYLRIFPDISTILE